MTCSAASAASASDCTGPECEPPPSASPTHSAAAFSPGTGPASRSIPISASSPPPGCIGTASGLTSSAAAFPARTPASPDGAPALQGVRTGLWAEMARLVAECRPGWVLAENVPGLRSRGADRVLAELEALGYACWPLVVGAVHAGAPHRRRRLFLVARVRCCPRRSGATGNAAARPSAAAAAPAS